MLVMLGTASTLASPLAVPQPRARAAAISGVPPAHAITPPPRIALREEGPEKGRSHRRLRGSRASRCTVAGRLRKRGSRQLRPRQTARQGAARIRGFGLFRYQKSRGARRLLRGMRRRLRSRLARRWRCCLKGLGLEARISGCVISPCFKIGAKPEAATSIVQFTPVFFADFGVPEEPFSLGVCSR